jgi:lysophospholipase L1-like esterase
MTDRRMHLAEAADSYCLREGEAARLLAGHPWRRFVVVGDSIAEGIGDSSPGYPDEPWCDRIAAELARESPGFAYLNLGTSNTPAAGVRDRQLAQALEFGPDLALVACGGYDMLRSSFDPGAAQAVLREIVAAFAERGADGSMRSHVISAAETIRCLGRHLDAVGRSAGIPARAAD